MSRRILAVMIAIVLATVGTGAVYLYVHNADQRAIAGQKARTVLVADKRIPAGTTGKLIRTGGYLRTVSMPAATVPDDALDQVNADLDNLVVTADVQKGQLLLRAMFGSQTAGTGGLRIPEGMVAIAARVKNDAFGPGQIRAGSRVAVFLTYTPLDDAHRTVIAAGGVDQGRAVNSVTRLLLANVEVLAVVTTKQDTTSRSTSGGSASGGGGDEVVITFAVTQLDAERLAHAVALEGEINVALLSDDSNVKPDNGVDNRTVF